MRLRHVAMSNRMTISDFVMPMIRDKVESEIDRLKLRAALPRRSEPAAPLSA